MLCLALAALAVVAVAGGAGPKNAVPLGDWSDTTTHCMTGRCKGQDFKNPTTVTKYDPATGEFSGEDGGVPISGKVTGQAVTLVYDSAGYKATLVGSISADGDSCATADPAAERRTSAFNRST